MQNGVTSNGGPHTGATRAMALVLAFNCSRQITIFLYPSTIQMSKVMALVVTPVCVSDLILYEASAAPTQMKGKQVKKRKVMALVFGQSWVRSWWLTICGAHVKRWTLELKF